MPMSFIKNNNNKKSIRSRITFIFIIVILIMYIALFFSIIRRNRISSLYQENVDINYKLNQMSLELNNNSRSFELYFQRREKDYLDNYMTSRNDIDELMKDLKEDIEKDETTNIFFRNLTNMLEYHDNLFTNIFAEDTPNTDIYEILTDVRTLYLYMNRHAQSMVMLYLDYSSKEYMELLSDYQTMEKKMYLIIIITSIFCFIFALALSNDILKTIDRLSLFARSLSKGHWEISDIKENKYSELDILGKTFNLMKNNIENFIKELKQKSEIEIKLNKKIMENIEKDRLLKESKLLNLQMQMDPHFLFNTLNTVARTALFENAEKTVGLIVAVSKIMRYNLDNKGKMVEMSKEIEVLKAYLTLQQLRFQEQMNFDISIDGDISGIKIPPMILQPIVENSIIHGLVDRDEDGEINIKLYRKRDYVEIEILDKMG